MQDSKTTNETVPTQEKPAAVRRGRERRTRRIVFGLTGLLGAAWALVIASRFPGILPG